MFTGIVEELGTVVSVPPAGRAGAFRIAASKVLEDAHLGDSIAVNGVCLTVTSIGSGAFSADVMPETLSRSSLGGLRAGGKVNLERAMAAGGRFGGHIVSGHIDGTGTVASRLADQNAVRVRIDCPAHILALIVEKGSIAIDGISLTVSGLFDDSFEVSVIPHTGGQTTLLSKKVGDVVNLENDVVGKYVQRLLGTALGGGAAPGQAGGAAATSLGGPAGYAQAGGAAPPSGVTLERLIAGGF